MSDLLSIILSMAVVGPGVLAPADPGCLEAVEARRVRYGYGLAEAAPAGVVLLAAEDCALIGYDGWLIVENMGSYPARVVDCQQAEHEPLSARGLLADVNVAELGHRKAILWLWHE